MKPFLVFAVLGIMFQTAPTRHAGRISAEEIVATLYQQSECNDPEVKLDAAHAISISHLEYYDLTGHGREEAIVVASTCMTGTAGPDVHAVFTRNVSGEVVELPFHREEGQPGFSTLKRLPVFGNPNYTLRVEKGLLVASWMDSSDRENPLTIRYKWNGSAFVVDSVQQTGPFKTSYDCIKAAKEIEQAICYSPSVAALDVELSAIYRANLQSLPVESKLALQNEQRAWLAQREKSCTVYKWWVECLTELYTKRIAELRQGKKG
jgi:uncharacterized protein YecT (DUF1311 family)